MTTLKQLDIGRTATVSKIGGAEAVKRRIMDMGITKGVQVTVRKIAPLGDPLKSQSEDMNCRCAKQVLSILRLYRNGVLTVSSKGKTTPQGLGAL